MLKQRIYGFGSRKAYMYVDMEPHREQAVSTKDMAVGPAAHCAESQFTILFGLQEVFASCMYSAICDRIKYTLEYESGTCRSAAACEDAVIVSGR